MLDGYFEVDLTAAGRAAAVAGCITVLLYYTDYLGTVVVQQCSSAADFFPLW